MINEETRKRSDTLGLGWLLAFVAFLPFDRFYSELALIGFALHTLIQYRRGDRAAWSSGRTLVFQSIFLLTVVCTIHTGNTGQAFSFWTRQLSIFLFPLLLAFTHMDLYRARRPLLLMLVATCCASLAWCYLESVRVLMYYGLPVKELFSSRFLNHRFSEPIGLHATYFSLYCALAALALLGEWHRAVQMRKKIILGLLLLFLMAGLLQLGSRAILIAVIVTGALLYPAMRLQRQQRKRFYLLAALALGLLLFAIAQVPSLRSRLFTDLQTDLARERGAPLLGTRAERWAIAWELVRERPLAGWGAGDEVQQLKERYYAHRMYTAYVHDLNAHNQYLSFLIRGGIGALLVYLFTLAYGFRLAWRQRNYLLAGFLMLVALVSVSENIFDVNKGIFFYAFFLPLLAAGEKNLRKPAGRGNRAKARLVSTS